jgi:hypothetical protein
LFIINGESENYRPNDEEEVNTRDIHKCDGQAHDPDTMTVPLTPKPTPKAESLVKAPPTIVSRRQEDVVLKEVMLCERYI